MRLRRILLAAALALTMAACGSGSAHRHAATPRPAEEATCGGKSNGVEHCTVTRANGETKHVTIRVRKGRTPTLAALSHAFNPNARPSFKANPPIGG